MTMKRCQDGSVNIVIGKHFEKHELELFKATEADNDPINFCDTQTSLPQLLKALGLFSSVTQAKKAGWDKQIDEGWNEFVIGKNRTKLFILKRELRDTQLVVFPFESVDEANRLGETIVSVGKRTIRFLLKDVDK